MYAPAPLDSPIMPQNTPKIEHFRRIASDAFITYLILETYTLCDIIQQQKHFSSLTQIV